MSYRDTNKNRKGPTKYLDLEKLDTSKLTIELKNAQNQSLLWIVDEINLQFDNMAEEFKRDEIKSYRTFAKDLKPFFKKYLLDENGQIALLCKTGLDFIYERFPDLNSQ